MKGRVYTIVYNWDSTSNNHAGMYYFATKLASKYPEFVIVNELSYSPDYDSFSIKFRKIIWFLKLSIKLIFCSSSKTDAIFFLEYLGNGWQKNISRFVRFFNGRIKIFAIVHLPIYFLNEAGYNNQELRKDCNLVDELIVLGSSLKKNLIEIGVISKIHFIHHYVDKSFYFPSGISSPIIKLIAYGNMMRDIDLLYKIILKINNLDLKIIICLATLTDNWGFCDLKNVEVYNYLSEEILLEKIQSADINLSVMTDTIGSNTIVTSMACGLAQVCSDVGSIRDYCNDSNAIFCNNTEDSFVEAIKNLTSNHELLRTMKMNSIVISNDFDLSVITNKIYKSLFSSNSI